MIAGQRTALHTAQTPTQTAHRAGLPDEAFQHCAQLSANHPAQWRNRGPELSAGSSHPAWQRHLPGGDFERSTVSLQRFGSDLTNSPASSAFHQNTQTARQIRAFRKGRSAACAAFFQAKEQFSGIRRDQFGGVGRRCSTQISCEV